MPRRSSYSSSGYYSREKQRKIPSPLPYFLIALIATLGLAYFHYFVFKSLQGKVTNAYTGGPMPNVPILVQSASTGATGEISPTLELTATTGPEGTFSFEKLPPDPVLSIDVDGFTPQHITVEQKISLNVTLVPNVVKGQVLGVGGKPVDGATVWAGSNYTLTKTDGTYSLKDIPAERKLVVKAPGYLSSSVAVGKVITQNITLTPFIAKALYISADSVATPGKLQELLGLLDTTELTAAVIDVKADSTGTILYKSNLPQVQQMGVSSPIIADLDALLADLKKRNIYTIARICVFSDEALSNAKPDWALKSKKAPGQPWLDAYGKRWSNPFMKEVWDYNIAIAQEVASRGFNEVLFDSAHFPPVGDLEDVDYGPAQAGRKRTDAISGFLDSAYRTLSPMGIYVSYNTFGLVPWVQDDMGVGQHFEDIAAHVDYISPDIYPSVFDKGFLNGPVPAEHPGDLVTFTMKKAVDRVVGLPAKVRPWLQDFSDAKNKYEAPQVRAEIDAAEHNGAYGWMLWNFGNTYTGGALKGQ